MFILLPFGMPFPFYLFTLYKSATIDSFSTNRKKNMYINGHQIGFFPPSHFNLFFFSLNVNTYNGKRYVNFSPINNLPIWQLSRTRYHWNWRGEKKKFSATALPLSSLTSVKKNSTKAPKQHLPCTMPMLLKYT